MVSEASAKTRGKSNYLDVIIQSHDMARTLEYFALNDEPAYLRDIARQIRVDHGNLSRILRTFERRGLLTSHLTDNKRYYRRNEDEFAWNAISALMGTPTV